MWTRTLLKNNAKQALRGRYWRSFWICLALSIAGLGGAGASSGSAARQAVDTTTGDTSSVYDILSGIPKGQAVQMALRTLSPQVILLDELGGMDELYALEQGLFSGVEFIATLHAASWEEAARRPQVQYLQKCGALHVAVLLKGRTAPGQLKEVRVS